MLPIPVWLGPVRPDPAQCLSVKQSPVLPELLQPVQMWSGPARSAPPAWYVRIRAGQTCLYLDPLGRFDPARPDPNPAQPPRFYPVRSTLRVGTIRPGSILSDPARPRGPIWSGPIRAGPALPKCTMGKPGPTRPCALAMATAMVIDIDHLGVRPSGGRRVAIFRITPRVISWGGFLGGAIA